MLKAIIFDLNGIFLLSEKLSVRFEQDFFVPVDVFLSALDEIMDKVRQPGAGSSFILWQPYLVKWGVNLTEAEFWKYWFQGETASQEMLTLAQELKDRNLQLFLLSNNFQERADYYSSFSWMSIIDKAYYSWQTGFVKPDPRAWQLVLQENNLQPEECMYFDDQQKNVDAAAALGIKSYIFESVQQTREKIE